MISWFIKSGTSFARVEEELFSLDERTLTFTREGIKYQLTSEIPLSPFLYGDVLFMRQGEGGKLLPFVLPDTLSPEEVISLNGLTRPTRPGFLKDLISQRTEKLKKYLTDYQDIIKFLVKLNAEKDLQSWDFIKDLQGFMENFYGEFLRTLERNIEDIVSRKRELDIQKSPSFQKPSSPIKTQTDNQPSSPAITQSDKKLLEEKTSSPSPLIQMGSSEKKPPLSTPLIPPQSNQSFQSLRQLLADTLNIKKEIENSFNVVGKVNGNLSYESLKFVYKITPPIKPLAIETAKKYFQVKDGTIILEGEGISGLSLVESNITRWLTDLKELAEARPT